MGSSSVLALLTLLAMGAVAPGVAAQQVSWPERPLEAHARPGWLGLSYDVRWVQHDSGCLPRVVVESVVDGAPADRAGLREGDRIIAVDGRDVARDALPFAGRMLRPGDSVRLRIVRPPATREILAVADLRPARPPLTVVRPGDGFSASEAPVITVEGDSIVARNVDVPHLWSGRGYWLAGGDGRAEYRRLDRFAGSGVDRRVSELLGCVAQSRLTAPAKVAPAPEQLHRRADSLRVVIARRAMARDVPGRVQVYAYSTADGTDGPRTVAGAELTSMEPDLAEYFRGVRDGVLVLRVASGTPAARAGLRPGDVITEAGGRRLDSPAALRALLSRPDPATVELRVVRHGRSRLITLRDGGG